MSQMTFTIDTADTISIRALAALVDTLTHSGAKTQQEVPAPPPAPIPQQPTPIQQPAPAVPAAPAYQPSSAIPTYQQPAPAVPAPAYQPTPVAPPLTPYTTSAPAAPNAPAALAPESLPTTASTYTLNQLSAAGTQLVDAGRRQEVIDLIHSYGVQMLQQIPPERYGEVATALRGMGAKI